MVVGGFLCAMGELPNSANIVTSTRSTCTGTVDMGRMVVPWHRVRTLCRQPATAAAAATAAQHAACTGSALTWLALSTTASTSASLAMPTRRTDGTKQR
jgi:hypothetical protein